MFGQLKKKDEKFITKVLEKQDKKKKVAEIEEIKAEKSVKISSKDVSSQSDRRKVVNNKTVKGKVTKQDSR